MYSLLKWITAETQHATSLPFRMVSSYLKNIIMMNELKASNRVIQSQFPTVMGIARERSGEKARASAARAISSARLKAFVTMEKINSLRPRQRWRRNPPRIHKLCQALRLDCCKDGSRFRATPMENPNPCRPARSSNPAIAVISTEPVRPLIAIKTTMKRTAICSPLLSPSEEYPIPQNERSISPKKKIGGRASSSMKKSQRQWNKRWKDSGNRSTATRMHTIATTAIDSCEANMTIPRHHRKSTRYPTVPRDKRCCSLWSNRCG
jgi:hypothetical protein